MSNPDKHKPLSAEELFKLLEENSNETSDFDALDDFEKEALEGFSAHSTPEKARALTEELNIAISKKASENKGAQKNKIIWFSAAASIVVIIMISVFFFNQSKQDSQTNLVLNEAKEDVKPTTEPYAAPLQKSVVTEPVETIIENSSTKKEDASLLREAKSQVTVSGKLTESEYTEGLMNGTTVTSYETKPSMGVVSTGAKDKFKSRNENDNDALQKQAIILADKVDDKTKEKSNLEQGQTLNNEPVMSQNTITTADTKSVSDELAYQYKMDANKNEESSKNTEKGKLEKEKAALESFAKAKAEKSAAEKAAKKRAADDQENGDRISSTTVNTAQAPGYVAVNNSNAYYEGGELAIRDFVVSYVKEKKITTPIIGKYKIMGVVDTVGKLKVISITQITKEYCGCSDIIKEALNAMKKWTPALQDGKNVPSNVEFMIGF